jgi:hypothetical protein
MESGYKHIQRGVKERGEEEGRGEKKTKEKQKKEKVARSFLVVFFKN